MAVVTLNDPERRNALDPEFALALADEFRRLDADSGVGSVVVTGAGKGFCAGANLGSLLDAAVAGDAAAALEHRRGLLRHLYDPFLALRAMRTPTIAAVNGAAVGAGLNLALAADLRVAAESALFISGFLRIGLHPGGGNTHMLTAVAGPEVAAAMTLFGETPDGHAAERAGLVYACVPDSELLDRARELAARAAGAPARVTRRGKVPHRLPAAADFATVLEAEATAQAWTTTLPETAALIDALRGG